MGRKKLERKQLQEKNDVEENRVDKSYNNLLEEEILKKKPSCGGKETVRRIRKF